MSLEVSRGKDPYLLEEAALSCPSPMCAVQARRTIRTPPGGVAPGPQPARSLQRLAIGFPGGAPPPTVAVFTPPWLPIAALIFATLIGLLSGLYPALRAATLAPVDALKNE